MTTATFDLVGFDGIRPTVTTGRGHVFSWVRWVDGAAADPAPHRSLCGTVPVVHLDGTFGLRTEDHDDWYPGPYGPLTIGVWMKPDLPVQKGNLFGQYAVDGPGPEARAWLLQIESAAPIQACVAAFRDEAVEAIPNLMKPRGVWPTDDGWHHLAAEFWLERPGVFRSALLIDGVAQQTSVVAAPNFLGMRNVSVPILIGAFLHHGAPFEPYYGLLAGGQCGPIWMNDRFTALQWTDYIATCRGALGI